MYINCILLYFVAWNVKYEYVQLPYTRKAFVCFADCELCHIVKMIVIIKYLNQTLHSFT